MLAAVLAILHEFQSVRVIFLVFLGVIISLLAFTARKSHFDSCIISHLAAPPILNYLIRHIAEPVYLPPESIGRRDDRLRIAREFRGSEPQRKSPLAEVLPLYHIFHSLSSLFLYFSARPSIHFARTFFYHQLTSYHFYPVAGARRKPCQSRRTGLVAGAAGIRSTDMATIESVQQKERGKNPFALKVLKVLRGLLLKKSPKWGLGQSPKVFTSDARRSLRQRGLRPARTSSPCGTRRTSSIPRGRAHRTAHPRPAPPKALPHGAAPQARA